MDFPFVFFNGSRMPPGFPAISEESEEVIFEDIKPLRSTLCLGPGVSFIDDIDDLAEILRVSQVTESGLPATSRPQLVRSRTLPAIVVPGAGDGDPDSQDDGVDKKDGRHAISNTASPIGGVRNFSLRSPPSPALLRVPNTDSRINALSRLLSPDRPSWTSLNDSSADCSPTPLRRSTSIDSLNRPSPPRSQPEDSSDSPPKPASQSQSRKGSAESPGIRRRLYKDKL
ncbi:uncharacterized protein LOC122375110, partial [Amphibalanus amphitrite]|uniref:uncharacterized protein LOC122375110 n=1 Tax=Amphibalanus amphitrite TaxID=1232801 RepID=UPI001C907682